MKYSLLIVHCDLKVSSSQAKIDENENENEAQLLYSVQLQRPISVYVDTGYDNISKTKLLCIFYVHQIQANM